MATFFETEIKITESQVKRLEERLNFSFPIEYVEHILKNNGGRCEPNIFSFNEEGKKTESCVDWFLAIYEGEYDNLETEFNALKLEEKRMPTSFFPIAHDPGGNYICMDSEDGKIYFWNHEKEVDYSLNNDSDHANLYLIAESLGDFISNLV
nr:SMI1/KNR4 family protein [uncultured Marinifilum sp.]